MLISCYSVNSLDQSDKLPPRHQTDPEWCIKVNPDCDMPYTKNHCTELCNKAQGKYTSAHELLFSQSIKMF